MGMVTKVKIYNLFWGNNKLILQKEATRKREIKWPQYVVPGGVFVWQETRINDAMLLRLQLGHLRPSGGMVPKIMST